jgi:hypothetical protein
MKKLARNTLALGTATLIVTAGLSFSANGADATKSYSAGRFLSGSIGGTNLDALAQVRGVAATNPGNAGANKNPLDLTVLSALPINLPGGLKLDLAKFLSASGAAGAVNQYAAAPSTGKAVGASGLVNDSGAVLAPSGGVPTDALVTLKSGPLAGINDNLARVDLGLGAVSSNTTVDNGTATQNYKIAGLNLQLGVPLLGKLVGDLSTAIAPLSKASSITISPAELCTITSSTLNVTSTALLAQLRQLGLGAVADLLDAVLNPLVGAPITSVNLCDTSNLLLKPVFDLLSAPILGKLIEVQITGVDQVTTGISNFSDGGVSVDLSNGKITLDLAQILKAAGVDLNNLPKNTDLVSYISKDLVANKIGSVLDSAINNIVAKIGAVNVKISLAGTTLPVDLDDLTAPLAKPLTDVLTQVSGLVKQVGAPVDQLLADLAPDLKRLVALTANNQSTSKVPTLSTGTVKAGNVGTAAVGEYHRTSALNIKVLNGAVNVDLAASEAATLPADATADGAAAAADDADSPSSDSDSDSGSDAGSDADGNAAGAGDGSDAVADADAQADADVTTTLPSTGAPNLLPFWLLGIALLLFGGAVLVSEKRRLSASI